MADNFATGENDSGALTPPVETYGATYAVKVAMQGPGAHEPQTEPYLLPSVHYRNGNMERVPAAITLTPLGGMMPGPNAIAPAIVVGTDYRAPSPEEGHPFDVGIGDGYPEGCPVPH